MAVTVQGYLALDLVKKNNVELVKGVDRASTTTVAALRTAVTVAQAMTNQKLVLEQISALNTTTAGMIDTTGEMLRTQTGAIHEQAASLDDPARDAAARVPEHLRHDGPDRHVQARRRSANMKQTVDTLGNEVEKSKGYIARAEGVAPGQARERQLAVHADRGASDHTTSAACSTSPTQASTARSPAFRPTGRSSAPIGHGARDEPATPRRAAARRERQRLNAGLGRTREAGRRAIVVGYGLATIVIGFIMPIGMFGFLAAVGRRHRCCVAWSLPVARQPPRGPRFRAPTCPTARWSSASIPISTGRAGASRAGAGRDRRDACSRLPDA